MRRSAKPRYERFCVKCKPFEVAMTISERSKAKPKRPTCNGAMLQLAGFAAQTRKKS